MLCTRKVSLRSSLQGKFSSRAPSPRLLVMTRLQGGSCIKQAGQWHYLPVGFTPQYSELVPMKCSAKTGTFRRINSSKVSQIGQCKLFA